MIIDAHAHIYEYCRPYGPRGEGRAIGGGLIQWPNGKVERFFPERYGDCGSVQQLWMLNRSANTDVWCVSDGFQHFLWNILHSLVEIHEPFVYSRD